MTEPTAEDTHIVRRATVRLNAQSWGVSFGLLCGLTLFAATLFLVVKGGENVGQHLGLLSVFLPGYRVSVTGAFLGFVYLFVIGYALGRLVGLVYNTLSTPR
jgi:hypothetical protein